MGSWKSRIPNFLSLSRVFLAGLLVVLFSSKNFTMFCVSMAIVAVAVLTDMTIVAEVILDQRTIIEWLFEPILKFQN